MSRKEDPKDSNNMVSVDIDDFTRTRDGVIVSLATLQSAVSDLSRAYINHANTVLNRGSANLDIGGMTTSLLENGLFAGHRPFSPSGISETGDKKKRKRARPDPNAPKRALTPYFLYMHHNRKKIADELESSARPKDVANEGKRRWDTMNDHEKQIWRDLYAENRAIYQKKMDAYKSGQPVPNEDWKDPSDQLLQGMQEAPSHAQEGEEEGGEEESEGENEEEDSDSSESEKAPSPPRIPSPKRRRTVDVNKPVSTPPTTKRSSPEKKKKPASATKAGREAQATSEKPKRAAAGASKAAVEENKSDKKRQKKKRRSDTLGSD